MRHEKWKINLLEDPKCENTRNQFTGRTNPSQPGAPLKRGRRISWLSGRFLRPEVRNLRLGGWPAGWLLRFLEVYLGFQGSFNVFESVLMFLVKNGPCQATATTHGGLWDIHRNLFCVFWCCLKVVWSVLKFSKFFECFSRFCEVLEGHKDGRVVGVLKKNRPPRQHTEGLETSFG